MSKSVIVVGAGPGGLAAAMLLAKAGVRVTVVESQPFVGGRTSTLKSPYQETRGFRFDRGPTFFLYPRILNEIFDACGYDLIAECPMERLDPQYRLVFGAGDRADQAHLDATPDVERMEQEIARISPADAPGFRRFLTDNRAKLDNFQPILEEPFYKLTDFLRPNVLRSAPLLRPWRKLYGEVGRFFKDPRLNLAFTFQGKYLGMSPFQCPSLFSILAFLEYEYGVFHPIGGCGRVSTRMAEIVTELGGEVRTAEPVEALLFDQDTKRGDRVVGVRTPRGEQRADAVVVNADFAAAMHKLTPDAKRRRWTDAKLAAKKYSCSTLMFYLGLEGTQPELPHHTIYLSSDYQRNLEDIERGRPLGDDPSIYVQNACVTDPSLAPEGHSTLYVLVPTANNAAAIDWQAERDRLRPVVFEQLEKMGVPDARRRVRVEHVIAPSDWQDDHRIYRGATFNLAHSLDQMLYWRPHNRFEDFGGTYLVGGGTHPGSGLPTIYSSARITVETLLDDLGVATPAAA
ncbi:MAG: phytoene desaturase family protein [Planctomycetota bacterium]